MIDPSPCAPGAPDDKLTDFLGKVRDRLALFLPLSAVTEIRFLSRGTRVRLTRNDVATETPTDGLVWIPQAWGTIGDPFMFIRAPVGSDMDTRETVPFVLQSCRTPDAPEGSVHFQKNGIPSNAERADRMIFYGTDGCTRYIPFCWAHSHRRIIAKDIHEIFKDLKERKPAPSVHKRLKSIRFEYLRMRKETKPLRISLALARRRAQRVALRQARLLRKRQKVIHRLNRSLIYVA